MQLHEFKGSPNDIGQSYGKTFSEQIEKNIDILVKRNGYEPLPQNNPDFKKWINDQESVIANNWPWLIDEMYAVAQVAKLEYKDILLLNLRAWQYDFYSGSVLTACSSMAIMLADGTVANAGALDDNSELYCGVVKVVPENGYSYVSFPITGTSWGNRGINSAGLCVGVSSQILPELERLSGTICADIANRIILQTCATVNDVKEFCKKHPFTLNLVCSDKNGDVFCAHNTSAGLFQMHDKAPCVMTNHPSDDQIMYKLFLHGVKEFIKPPCHSRERRGRLLEFAEKSNGKANAQYVRDFIADRMNGAAASACPKNNIILTYSNPQVEPGIIWLAEPQITNSEKWIRYEYFK